MNKHSEYKMVATTMHGLEEVLSLELTSLGARDVKILNRAVEFFGDLGFMYKANLNLRTAIRILKPIYKFQSFTQEDFYRKVSDFNWTKYLNVDNTFCVNIAGFSPIFTHSKYTALLTKDAIVDYFRIKFKKRPNIDLDYPDVKIYIHLFQNEFTISLDSSGSSLHKRGYKVSSVEAPINEVLAAGLILLSDWNRLNNFYDPMCGSSTFLIEAAMIAKNIPPNIFRKRFGFESWTDFDQDLWMKIKDISLDKEIDFLGEITGSDILRKCLRSSRSNINNALMRDDISVFVKDFFDSNSINSHVIFNPPYGERLLIGTIDFYKKIGDVLKHKYQGCTVWIITSDLENVKYIGLKPSKKIKVYNGKLECRFLRYDIYSGSKKVK